MIWKMTKKRSNGKLIPREQTMVFHKRKEDKERRNDLKIEKKCFSKR